MQESLDWELGQLYYRARGHQAFLSGDVPFVINNDGFLSAHAAHLAFEAIADADLRGALPAELTILEMGPGLGLFALYFLDSFREICSSKEANYYERLSYILADRSAQTINDLRTNNVLSRHADRCRLTVTDAWRSGSYDISAVVPRPTALQAVFLNYFLDCLPAAIVRRADDRITQLCARTRLARNADFTGRTTLTPEEIRERANSDDPALKGELIELFDLLVLEYEFMDLDCDRLLHAACALEADGCDVPHVLDSFASIQCLQALRERLSDGGFVLVSDYGYEGDAPSLAPHPYQRYGASTQIGINFRQLKWHFTNAPGCCWLEPPTPNDHIHVRLLGNNPSSSVQRQFVERFDKPSFDYCSAPVAAAREHAADGRREAALAAYSEALRRQHRNWALTTEIGQFVLSELKDPKAARALAAEALLLNPFCTGAWNCLGDCFYALGQMPEAHRAYAKALTLSPEDSRARHNLVYTYSRMGNFAAALKVIAEGLAIDGARDEYRDRLLERQSEVLQRLSAESRERARRLRDRYCGLPATVSSNLKPHDEKPNAPEARPASKLGDHAVTR